MAVNVFNNTTATCRRLAHIFFSSRQGSDPNIGLQENPPQYFDDPGQGALQPQQYLSPVTGEPCPLKVQSTSLGGELQSPGNWIRVNASGHADPILWLSAWVTNEAYHYSSLVHRVLALLGAITKAILLSPLYGFIISRGIDADVPYYFQTPPPPIRNKYPEFLGRCRESPKHGRGNLNNPPASFQTRLANEDHQSAPVYTVKEQKRLYRPRKLFVKINSSWVVRDGGGTQTEMPYIFISYAANQFQRTEDSSGRLVLTEKAEERLKKRAEAVTEQYGLEAYWIDFLRARNQPEATDDVHRFCDVVRGCEQVCVLLAEDRDMSNSLAMFGKRLWCLPECLLAPKHSIYVQGGGKSEMISIIGELVEGKGKEEEFRLLAEDFSGLLDLGRLVRFSVALSAMRALDFFPFQNGDIAYALMGLLQKRPAMDPTDSEEQALVRLCLANDSDSIIERIACILPSKDDDCGWFSTNDFFGENLWDIEPLCQVVGICNDEALIIDSCHGVSICWESIPRIHFRTRKTAMSKALLHILLSSKSLAFIGLPCLVGFIILRITYHFLPISRATPTFRLLSITLYVLYLIFKIATISSLGLSFVAPFCMPFVYGGQILEIQPCLIGIEGTMPIDQLERMVFGTVAGPGRLEYTTPSGTIYSRDGQTQTGVPPVIDPETLPAGHRIFTLIDTGNLTVTLFSAARPPTVALLCGKESGMIRAVLCSYNHLSNSLRRETVLRMETSMWNRSSSLGWVKLAMS